MINSNTNYYKQLLFIKIKVDFIMILLNLKSIEIV
jgi:hypothetical protein